MNQVAEQPASFCQSCKASEAAWAIIDPKKNTLHRITFSESLARLIVEQSPEYEVEKIMFHRGKKLAPGEDSAGLYGITSTDKDLVLRIHLRKELAEIYASDPSRHIEEIFISRPNKT